MGHRPLIALLTDFGTRDHYVGTMKGVILGVCPDASLVDISHDIPAHDVLAGAFELAASYRYFPQGAIFLVVVDPGVGSIAAALPLVRRASLRRPRQRRTVDRLR
jgi:S-adenosylmethionine hydrolase